jgi:hypothetical protein
MLAACASPAPARQAAGQTFLVWNTHTRLREWMKDPVAHAVGDRVAGRLRDPLAAQFGAAPGREARELFCLEVVGEENVGLRQQGATTAGKRCCRAFMQSTEVRRPTAAK